MTPGAPAGAAREVAARIPMVVTCIPDLPRNNLLLEVTFVAKVMIAGDQHPLIHTAVRIVAGGATFTHRLVFKYERPILGTMTFEAGFIRCPKRCATPFYCGACMRIVTIGTANLSVFQRMVSGHAELPALVEMALEASLRRFFRVDDRVACAARFLVDAARSVTGLAPDVHSISSFGAQTRMSR